MGGKERNDDERGILTISEDLLDHLFMPLQEVLKEQSEALNESAKQLGSLVYLFNSTPTRKDIIGALGAQDKSVNIVLLTTEQMRSMIIKAMWVAGILWASAMTLGGVIIKLYIDHSAASDAIISAIKNAKVGQ